MEKAIKKYWPIFVLPTLAAFIIGFIIPFLQGAYLAFCQFTTVRDATFIGISNFISALRDATFTHAFWYNCAFVVVSTLAINVGGPGTGIRLGRLCCDRCIHLQQHLLRTGNRRKRETVRRSVLL